IDRPQSQYKGDASSFFNTGSLSHELKFGAGVRKTDATTTISWPGVGFVYGYGAAGYGGYGPGVNLLILTRDQIPKATTKYTSAYVQDTMTVGNLTGNVGIRYDKQTADNL